MAVPVEVFVKSDDAVPVPLGGVVVSLFDLPSLSLAASSLTDSFGQASLLVPGDVEGKNYQVRAFKMGAIFGPPRTLQVLEPASSPNKFDMFGVLIGTGVATDPNLCRCSGRFVDFSNKPLYKRLVRISAVAEFGYQKPRIVESNMVAAEAMDFWTDAQGFLVLDLFRGGEYWLTFAGEDDAVWPLKIPDRSSANLIELLHPVPASLEWDSTVAPSNVLEIPVGTAIDVPFSVLFTSFETLTKGLSSWLDLFNSNEAVFALEQLDGTVSAARIRALAPGTATVTAVPKERAPSRRPAPVSLQMVLIVTVTP
jgi:hypothetical protein